MFVLPYNLENGIFHLSIHVFAWVFSLPSQSEMGEDLGILFFMLGANNFAKLSFLICSFVNLFWVVIPNAFNIFQNIFVFLNCFCALANITMFALYLHYLIKKKFLLIVTYNYKLYKQKCWKEPRRLAVPIQYWITKIDENKAINEIFSLNQC